MLFLKGNYYQKEKGMQRKTKPGASNFRNTMEKVLLWLPFSIRGNRLSKVKGLAEKLMCGTWVGSRIPRLNSGPLHYSTFFMVKT